MDNPLVSVIINTRNREEMLYSLLRCVYNQSYKNIEVIVVDDCSDKNYEETLLKEFVNLKFFRNERRNFLIKSRNKWFILAKWEILFFIDDDNEIFDNNLIEIALSSIYKNDNIGILGCRSYYFNSPDVILVWPNSFNFITWRVTFYWFNKIDKNFMPWEKETFDNPNAFFIKKSVLEKVWWFTEEIIQTMSEADLAAKVRANWYFVLQNSWLKVYHKSPEVDFKNMWKRFLWNSPERAYYLIRNKYYFIKKYWKLFDKLMFILIFHWQYLIYYSIMMFKNKEYDFLKAIYFWWKDGLVYFLFNKLNNYYE